MIPFLHLLSLPAASAAGWCASSEAAVQHTMEEISAAVGAGSCKQAARRLARSRSLDLTDSGLTDLRPLHDAPVEILLLGRNQLTDISTLETMGSLRWLDLSGNPLADLSPLSEAPKLETLWLGDTEVEDIGPLSGLSSLRSLGIGGTPVSSVEALRGLSLSYLGLGGSQVQDLRPIRRMKSLKALDVSGIPVDPGLCPVKAATEIRYKCIEIREASGWQADPSTGG